MDSAICLLIDFLEQAYNKKAWHGTTLRGSIRNVEMNEALWRPSAKYHNIRESIVHAAYWKYAIWRRISGNLDSHFEYPGSDWLKLPPKCDEKIWKFEIGLLKRYHDLLIKAVGQLKLSDLEKKPPNSKTTYKMLILGIGSHDLYHAGQIQLLKRLQRGGIVK
ncbi:MAG: DinB family protein [Candidatus Zixiibacteriota bacterium]